MYDDICDKCAHVGYCDMATFGGHNPKITACCKFTNRHQTNADRIRQMTDEELAEFISTQARTFGEEYEGYMSALDWLEQDVER